MAIRLNHLLLFACLLMSASNAESADIYRCQEDGRVEYSDEPCADTAERIIVEDNRIGGQFDQNLPATEPAEPETESEAESTAKAENESESTCRFINSTDLRRYLIREQVVKGMTKEHVIEAFGRPPETYPTPQETWVYQTRYYGALYELTLVYFRDGCVEDVEYRKP